MPPPLDDAQSLLDIHLRCEHIAQLVAEFEPGLLVTSWRVRALFEYELIILGESVKRLSPQFRETHPDIRWAAIAGLRDVLVHRYDRVDAAQVWGIASESVPQLLGYIEPMVPRQDND
ncbi:MAG: hypothetical protein C0506_12930 [Anaerolinea sp.]|nr:hypothetical protein [Anaerolinea sp.]